MIRMNKKYVVSVLFCMAQPMTGMDYKKDTKAYLIARYYNDEAKADVQAYQRRYNDSSDYNFMMQNGGYIPRELLNEDHFIAQLQKTELIDISELHVPDMIISQDDFDDVIRAVTNFLQEELSIINRYFCNGHNEVCTSWKLCKLGTRSSDGMMSVKFKAAGKYDYEDGSYPPAYAGSVTKKVEHILIMPADLYYQNNKAWNCIIS